MNKNNWYLANKNTWLYGKEAYDYVLNKVNGSRKLIKDVFELIDGISELETSQILKDAPITNIYDEYLDIEEKLSLIEISLEMILKKIRRHNNNDWRIQWIKYYSRDSWFK